MSKTIETLTDDESTRLLCALLHADHPKSSYKNQVRNFTMALLMLDAGLRVGEVVSLRVNQLWFADEPVAALTIEVSQSKTKQQRTIPLTERTRDAIKSMFEMWWSKLQNDLSCFAFFESCCDTPISIRQVQRIITKASKLMLGRSIHPHILRHTFATRLMRKCNIRVVQQLLGHASLQSTQVYTHPNHQDLQNAIDSLNETTVTAKTGLPSGPEKS